MTNSIKGLCPNCEDPNPAIENMSDGSCGVCGGTGVIEWKSVGKLVSEPAVRER